MATCLVVGAGATDARTKTESEAEGEEVAAVLSRATERGTPRSGMTMQAVERAKARHRRQRLPRPSRSTSGCVVTSDADFSRTSEAV
jgi:hypothetical protein